MCDEILIKYLNIFNVIYLFFILIQQFIIQFKLTFIINIINTNFKILININNN